MSYNPNKIPKHIAIIMDGNGRWARDRGLSKIDGHRAGSTAVEEAVNGCLELGVEILSLFTFSTENWNRPRKEVNALMKMLQKYLQDYLPKLKRNELRLIVSGDKSKLPDSLIQQIARTVSQSSDNAKLTVNLALNYGGREEILQAVKAIALRVKQGGLNVNEIDERIFSAHLYTNGLPDPDLLIRTSNERRLSNFFLWQISYCELYFTPKLWPDFKKEDLLEAVSDYQKRERRFGA